MLDLRADSIIYQSQTYLVTLLEDLVDNKRLGKALNPKWDKADQILGLLEAFEERAKIEDITQMNYVLECLISLCRLNQFPAAPTFSVTQPPAVIIGEKGETGDTGATGATGATGLATDFQVSLVTIPTAVDSFDITDGKGARWDYIIQQDTGEQRAGSVIGTWLDDGTGIAWFDTSTEDITGDTVALVFSVELFGSDIRLVATPASGTWTVIGTRYFIPNNGNGSGPVSAVLANGKIYIGNASNIAAAQTVSGDITITNLGVVTIANDAITNIKIDAAAGIELTKLEALVGNFALVSDGSGFISESPITASELSALSGIDSNIQDQLDLKLTDPTTTIGDLIIRDASNLIARLPIGTAGQVLTVAGGAPTWSTVPGGISGLTTGVLTKATSATTIGDSIITETGSQIIVAGTVEAQSGIRTQTTGAYLKTKILDITTWDMDAQALRGINHNVDYTKIRDVQIIVRADSNVPSVPYYPLDRFNFVSSAVDGGIHQITSTAIEMYRRTGGIFDSADFNDTSGSYNRGWILITYEE